MLDIDDVQLLTILDRGPDEYIRKYFLAALGAVFPDGGMDHVLGGYMSFLGRTVIRNGFGILAIDRSDSRPFEALIEGANPSHRLYGVVEGAAPARAAARLERACGGRRADCALYRMSVAEALAARLLEPVDLIVVTNIRDAAAAERDLSPLLDTVARAPGRVILHGTPGEVDAVLERLGPAAASRAWEFGYSPNGADPVRIASFRLQAASQPLGRAETAGRVETASFDGLGVPVPFAALADSEDSHAEVVPSGGIPDMATEAALALPPGERPLLHYDAFRCAHLRGARLVGHSGVIDRKGRLITDSLCAQKELVRDGRYWEMPHIIPHKEGGYYLKMPAVGQHCYRKALLLTQAWEENYQHWLFEILPQVIAAWRANVDTVIVSSDIRRYQRRALELLGFTGDRIVTHDLAQTMYCDSLLAGSFTAFNMGWVNPAAFEVYDRLMEATKPNARVETPERVYISRSDAEWKRRLLNEGELIERLSSLGFVAINPGALEFDDEVQVLSKAKIIVGAIGAGMSNMVFAPPGADVVAIQSPSFGLTSRFFPMLASLRNQRWHQIVSVALNPSVNEVPVGGNDNINILVDIDAVEAKVQAILATQAVMADV